MDDLIVGDVVECGHYSFTEDEVVDFARRHDPQPFHIFHEAARHSLFGRLTASGFQSASAARHAVLREIFSRRRLLAFPRVRQFRMHKPVYPGMQVGLRYQALQIETLADVPGAILVEGLTQGRSEDGSLVCEMRDLNWIGAAGAASSAVAAASEALQVCNGPSVEVAEQTSGGRLAAMQPDERIYFEDCRIGDAIRAKPFVVAEEDVEVFGCRFDTPEYRNEWLGPCFSIPMLADVFWCRVENTGGPGVQDLQIFKAVAAGDVLTGTLSVAAARPLKSRPGLGAVTLENLAWNQYGQPVFFFVTTSFLRMREVQGA